METQDYIITGIAILLAVLIFFKTVHFFRTVSYKKFSRYVYFSNMSIAGSTNRVYAHAKKIQNKLSLAILFTGIIEIIIMGLTHRL